MSEDTNTPTPDTRALRRRQGKRMKAKERTLAQQAFLAHFAETANVRYSCEASGIDRSTFYQWLEMDEVFSLAYHHTVPDANDVLFSEAWRRAVKGTEEPVVSMGTVVFHSGKPLTVRKYSDALLMFLMKARMPEYRDKQQDITIQNVNMQVERNELYARMQDEELDRLEQMYQAIQERRKLGN